MDDQMTFLTCKDVLDQNQNGNHTMPAPSLYPHQWLWDSCFTAIGLRHYDAPRAQKEIESLFKGQWQNGMIPHMIFDESRKYSRDRAFWSAQTSPYSPDTCSTSGITQPPVIAEAVNRVGQSLKKQQRLTFYKQSLPRLIKYHTWLMTERDPHSEGLVLQIHPWETGLDNTPPWMLQLHEHSKPWWIASIERVKVDKVFEWVRRDTRRVAPGQRISTIEALMVWDIVRRFRRKSYDISKILHRSLFCIEDIGFNSILARNNQLILSIAKEARMTVPNDFLELASRQSDALEDCWNQSQGSYYSRDFITHELILEKTVSSLLPLYSGAITKERAAVLVKTLTDHHEFGMNHPVPSVPLSSTYFDAKRYWQGPTWINTNWLIIDGLERYGYSDEAAVLREQTIKLVSDHGSHEYFSPVDSTPLGSPNFSWTAALTIDLLAQK